jgi:hypothetical protein
MAGSSLQLMLRDSKDGDTHSREDQSVAIVALFAKEGKTLTAF